MKEKIREIFSIRNDIADYDEIKERIVGASNVTGTNLCILMLAILIASIGLNMNSTAVIIGAMLISPIMGTIQAMGYGVAASDLNQAKRAGIGFLFQIIICLVTSTLYFKLSPISTGTSELLARTQPNIWDVMIASCGGLAGIIGITRKEKSNVIPGVAIATALMPPLCTCGYGIAHSNLRISLGAGYLFLVNAYFICITSMLVLIILKVPKEGTFSVQQRKTIKSKLITNTILIMIPSLVVAGIMVRQADIDNNSVTGFERVISVDNLTQEINILFPSISDVKIGTLKSLDKNGRIVSKPSAIVYLKNKMGKDESKRFEKWMKKVYNKNCELTFIFENKEQ